MRFKTLLIVSLALLAITATYILLRQPIKQTASAPTISLLKSVKPQPSKTLKDYTDPSGFSFIYPDNLSLGSNEIEDSKLYADLSLSSKQLSGSLNLKISDSKFNSLNDWASQLHSTNLSTSQKKLGNLNALEIKQPDRLLLAALDQGILFTVEMPRLEEDFWDQVYDSVLTSFSFTAPGSNPQIQSSNDSDATFEGEEVVE